MPPAPAPIILVMGATGSGKSTFINKHLPAGATPLPTGDELNSITKEMIPVDVTVGGRTITLVDTPGFDDSDKPDFEIAQTIANWLADKYRSGYKINGIVFMRDIRKLRTTSADKANRVVFEKLVGKQHFNKIVLMTSFWPRPSDEAETTKCVEREKKLREIFWKDLTLPGQVGQGATTKRFNIYVD